MRIRARAIAAVVIAVVAIALGVDVVRLALAARDIRDGSASLRYATTSLGKDPSRWNEPNLSDANRQQVDGSRLVSRGASTLQSDPTLNLARWIPGVGDQAQTVLAIAASGQAASKAEADLIDVARQYRAASVGGGSQPVIVLRFLTASAADFKDAHTRLAAAEAALRTDRSHRLLPPIRAALDSVLGPITAADKQAALGAAASQYLPGAMGASGPRTYLILLPNPSEQRPAGGFYGAIGYVTVDHGQLTNVDIQDSGPFSPRINPPVPVPAALGHYLIFARNALDVSDAGWDPDFPSTAKLAESMMRSATGREVDGTISLDPYAISALLAITGPVTVPPYGTFTSDDFFTRLNVLVNTTPTGKTPIGPVAGAIVTRVLSQPSDRLPSMLEAVHAQALGRHLEMYSHDASLQQLLAGARFDGAVVQVPVEDDYLATVDANVGGTKGDLFVKKSMNLKVERYSTGIARHELTVRYVMPAATDETDRLLNPHGGAYRDYVRFYLPEAAAVRALYVYIDGRPTTENSLESMGIEHGKRVAATFLNIPRGHSAEVHLFYEVPLNPASTYSLLIQKQAGSPGLDATLEVSLPGSGIRRPALDLRQDDAVRLDW